MIICSVIGMFVIALVFWLIVPRVATTVLVVMILNYHYPWLLSVTESYHHHVWVTGVVIMSALMGGTLGFHLDFIDGNKSIGKKKKAKAL